MLDRQLSKTSLKESTDCFDLTELGRELQSVKVLWRKKKTCSRHHLHHPFVFHSIRFWYLMQMHFVFFIIKTSTCRLNYLNLECKHHCTIWVHGCKNQRRQIWE